MTDQRHVFGPFVLDVPRGQLLRDGKAVTLGQRGLALLRALVEADGQVVAKGALMERAWPGAFVEEGNLTVQIAALRKCLGDGPDGQPWIVTMPRVGYRLLPAPAPPRGPEPATPARPALAVLPFANVGGDPGQDYAADGVVTEIITALARYRSLAVVSHTSSFAYKGRGADVREVARELGVRYVLEGSLQRAGDRLRITAHLVDAATGAHLWAEQFDGALADVFDFQDRITDSVATLVEPRITAAEIARSRRERPGSVAAYDLYLRSLAKVAMQTAADNADGLALVNEALALEPDNAVFLAHAAWALHHRITLCWPPFRPDDRQRCAERARRALENAGGDGAVMAKCGNALIHVAKDYDLAMAALQAAAEANPNDLLIAGWTGVGHLHCGSLDAALAHFHRANRLGPGDLGASFSLCGVAHVQMILGNYAEALVWATRALAANPNYECSLWMLIAANAHLGRMSEARRFLEDLRRLSPGATVARIRAGQPAKDPGRIAAILEGLRLAGLPEDDRDEPAIPNLAVLPFANLGADPEQDWFSDGVVDDIITALSRFRSFAVIARNSSFTYKGRATDVRQVARELGVRYVLEGSVRRSGGRLRITAQLVEGVGGAHLWAEQFDGAVADVFDFQDRITERVAMEVEPHIHFAEVERSRLERPGSIAAYDIYLQALAKINNMTAGDNAAAYALLTEAIALEPDNALLLAHAAWALGHRSAMGWPPFAADDMQKCAEFARRGLQHAAGNPTVMAHCGNVLIHAAKEYDWGMAVLRSAAEANPNSLVVAVAAGIVHLHCGSIEDALDWFHRALRLSPRDPFAFVPLTGIAHAQMVLGDYPEALVWGTRSLALNPTFDCTLWMLSAANAHLGRMGDARRFLQELRALAPDVTVASIRAGQPAKDPSRVAAILDGLRLAGLPEG